jgi:hypothetical protein
MIELLIISLTILGMIGVYVWPRITWGDEDWEHLRLEGWDETASRGRIRNKG